MLRIVFLAVLMAGFGAMAPHGAAWAQSITVDFETLLDGRPPPPGVLRGYEYASQGIRFPEGLDLIQCGRGMTCEHGSRGDRVVRALFRTEFERYPLSVEFAAPRRAVTIYVKLDTSARRDFSATLTAYDASGRVVASRAATYPNDGTWRAMTVSDARERITRVVLSGGAVGEHPISNFLLVDQLVVEGAVAPPPATAGMAGGPRLVIMEPAAGSVFDVEVRTDGGYGTVRTHFSARIDATARVRSVHMTVTEPDGRHLEGEICGDYLGAGRCASSAPGYGFDLSWPGEYMKPGEHLLRLEAFDEAGRTAVAERRFTVRQPAVPEADVWVMGIEYNQDIQDTLFTDLDRPPGLVGFVPLYAGAGPSTSLARRIPIVPGKPLAVRVYVGLRDTPATSTDGVDVTGTLSVSSGLYGDLPRSFQPLQNPNCQEWIAGTAGNTCRSEVRVRPSFGRLGLYTNSDYALDLIDQRVRLEGTLNFVIPGELLNDLAGSGGLILGARVQPARMRDPNPGDNDFILQLDNVGTYTPADVRLVRVALPGTPAPTLVTARRALADSQRLLPLSEIRIAEDLGVFTYRPHTVRLRWVTGDTTDILEQCQTLWMDLYSAFGLHPTRTLIALVPSGATLTGCGRGLGWKVQKPEFDWAGSPAPEYFGGIALSEAPPYAGPMADRTDMPFVTTLAMEFAHAHFDARHVSNLHGEASGCPAEFLRDLIAEFTNVDPDCWKPTPHPHGAIGTYPATAVEIAQPLLPGFDDFTPLGVLQGRIFGDFGGVGLRIEPEAGAPAWRLARGQDWRLTLYDPCPVGGLDRSDPLASLGQRVDLDSASPEFMRYRCAPAGDPDPDNNVVTHHFLSYGSNRWAGFLLLPSVTMSDIHPAAPRPPIGEAMASAPSGTGAPGASAGALRLGGLIDGAGHVFFLPASPSEGGAPADPEDAPLTVTLTDDRGRSLSFPAGIALTPAHGPSYLFFGAAVPPGLKPRRIAVASNERGELGHAEASPNPPQVAVLSPNGGELWVGDESATVSWKGGDPDGDSILYAVSLSADGGATWQPLGRTVDETTLEVPLAPLPTTQTALVRVVASDGLNIVEDAGDGVFAINMPPVGGLPAASVATPIAPVSPAPVEAGPQPEPPIVFVPCSARVAEVQERLNKLGYDAGVADGKAGTRTRGAIRAFEQDQGLTPSGQITDPLCTALDAAEAELPTLPDLVLESGTLKLAQSCRPDRPLLELTAVVVNRGASATSQATDLAWRHRDLAGWRGQSQVPPLGANEKLQVNLSIPYPEGMAGPLAGAQRFDLSVNDSRAVRERDRANNRLARAVAITIPEGFCPPPTPAVVALPDLNFASAQVVLGKICAPGEPVLTIVAVVANTGTAANAVLPSGGVSARARDGSGWGGEAGLPSLAPGQSTEVVIPIYYYEPDPQAMLGTRSFDLVVNPDGAIPESDAADNAFAGRLDAQVPEKLCAAPVAPAVAGGPPDVVIRYARIDPAESCVPGQPVLRATVTLANDGATASPSLKYGLRLVRTGATVAWASSITLPPIQPGETVDLVVPLPYLDKDPKGMLGLHDFLVTANDKRVFPEADHDNNVASLRAEVPDWLCGAGAQAPPPAEQQPQPGQLGIPQLQDLFPGLVTTPQGQRFDYPKVQGYLVDWCLFPNQSCGQPAATTWCQRNGFKAASAFEQEPDIGAKNPTITLGAQQICQSPGCDAFRSITCGN